MTKKLTVTFTLLMFLITYGVEAQSSIIDITKYGAKPNGDATQALLSAWKEACASTSPCTIVIPTATFGLNQVKFQGPCKAPIELQIKGTLKAPTDVSSFKDDGPSTGWITFYQVSHVTISGHGTIDGQGSTSWGRNDCQKNAQCKMLPMNMVIEFMDNSVIHNITSINSKNFHFSVFGSNNLRFQSITITAPGNSPNTDGIHIGRSTQINITDAKIQTGDDCISIGDGSKQISITKVTCGPGHGISVGSLGRYPNEQPVEGVFVRNCTLSKTMNGVRIKTWPASPPGIATDVHFTDVIMNQVQYPILIDQEYCPNNQCKQGAPSRVKISKVSFKNIRGTSATQEAVKLVCSSAVPCESVEIADVDLAYNGVGGSATSTCKNIKPIITGKQNPPLCTQRS